jgi:hypothetical protein
LEDMEGKIRIKYKGGVERSELTSARLLSSNTLLVLLNPSSPISRANRGSGLTDFRVIRLLHLQSILDDGNTSIGNNTVNRTESLVNLLKGSLDLLGVSNITLPSLDLDTVLLCEVGCYVVGVGGRVEDDCYVCGSSGEGFGDCESDT